MSATGLIVGSIRILILLAALCFVARRQLKAYLFPHGLPVEILKEARPHYSAVFDPTNDSLQAKHGKLTKVIERVAKGEQRILKGPESVVVDNQGTLYALTEMAQLVRLDDFQPLPRDPHTKTANATVVAELGAGRPLGGAFTPDGSTLYIADGVLGLVRIAHPKEQPNAKVQLVANKVMDEGVMTRIIYADDVAVGKSGKVYFSDASDVMVEREPKHGWDPMYASKVECIRGKPTGRLLEYDPTTEKVTVLARDLYFANGVAVDPEETYILFAQTYAMSLTKYHLTGPRQGTLEEVVGSDRMPGFPDGVDCADAAICFAAVPSPVLPVMKLLKTLPEPFDRYLRAMLMILPKSMTPKALSYGGFVVVNMADGTIRTIQDPTGLDLKLITGVTFHGNKLYLGSLENDVVGIYDLASTFDDMPMQVD